jgi:hypothetical protein
VSLSLDAVGHDADGAVLENTGASNGVQPLDQGPAGLRGCGRGTDRDKREQPVRRPGVVRPGTNATWQREERTAFSQMYPNTGGKTITTMAAHVA